MDGLLLRIASCQWGGGEQARLGGGGQLELCCGKTCKITMGRRDVSAKRKGRDWRFGDAKHGRRKCEGKSGNRNLNVHARKKTISSHTDGTTTEAKVWDFNRQDAGLNNYTHKSLGNFALKYLLRRKDTKCVKFANLYYVFSSVTNMRYEFAA